jgi:FAD/FMN-containing dehydrogenase
MDSDDPIINTGVLSQNPTQFAQMWALREGITEAISKEGKVYKYDISIPLQAFKEVIDTTREHIRSKGLLREGAVRHVLGYGHVGDGKRKCYDIQRRSHNPSVGNLHLNIVSDVYSPEVQDALEPFIYELVGKRYLIQRVLI